MATRKRASKLPTPATTSVPTLPRERFRPAWLQSDQYTGSVHADYYRLAQLIEWLREGRFRLPIFQRPYVWTDEQVLALLDSLKCGYHVGELLLWKQHMPASTERFNDVTIDCPTMSGVSPAMLVVDGQQRLGAIATAALSWRFAINVLTGEVVIGQMGAWLVPMSLVLERDLVAFMQWSVNHCCEYAINEDELRDAYAATTDQFGRARIGYVELPAQWPMNRVLESYRRLNTCGSAMDAEQLAQGLQRAMEH